MRKKIFKYSALLLICFVFVLSCATFSFAGYDLGLPSPVSSPVNAGYLYGEKLNSSSTYGHMGMDFAAPIGTSIYSTYVGKVITKGDLGGASYGKYIVIESTHPYYTNTKFYHYYCHMSELSSSIQVNTTYPAGTYLGLSGQTGNASGPHLHYEIRMGANNWYAQRNPEGFLGRSSKDNYAALRGKVLTSSGSYARAIRISGATKGTDVNYGASYSYYVMENGSAFPDESAYGLNYYITRINPGSITLNYNNGARTSTVSASSNTDTLVPSVSLP
ncbi:Peptidase M23 [Desulfitobacterium hafniense DCB-2]|uniref:Peptidase M23 n=1 Tax=Desulfitobacterium hafniense (strain DSM 10664 / DCB-2) TaxID=272564 RepID=B8FRR4_DESHD|nr:M23 family metallopeptidase [Desulfitobacterium hafniense]ACL21824.1 Peptidase M23 [Desulfitobacterium hafniense DCB-2]